MLDSIVESGAPVRANRALASIKKFFAWCADRGALELSPVSGLKPPTKEVARDRVLTDDELAAVWRAAENEGGPFGKIIQLLILTGQRRSEIANLTWEEVDLDGAVMTFKSSRVKNGQKHIIPLPQMALDIFETLLQNGPFVFTFDCEKPVNGFSRLKERLDEKSGVTDWRLHDLRRTMSTNLAMMGIRPEIVERILNHKTGSISQIGLVYNKYSYQDVMREALEKWSNRVMILAGTQRQKQPSYSKVSGKSLRTPAQSIGS